MTCYLRIVQQAKGRNVMRFCSLFGYHARWFSVLRAFIVILVLTASSAFAQTAPSKAATDTTPPRFTVQEHQGFGCLTAGFLGALGAYIYSDIIAIAVTGVINPALGVPVLVSGFAVACGVGSASAPALLRMYYGS